MNKWNERKYIKGFTLMELMVCVVLISIIAAFGIPNYQKAIRKGYERNAILNLKTIHGANEIYRARAGEYLSAACMAMSCINSGLGINIVDSDVNYGYVGNPNTFTAEATRNLFFIEINEDPISDSNPCCVAPATCLIVPDC